MGSLIRQIGYFVAVGCAAAATHWLSVVLLVSQTAMSPLVANFLGWLIAFGVSFGGHYQLTFKQQAAPIGQAARRFFLVSALGFAVNELSYAGLLQYTTIRYDVLLALILIVLAVMTFVLGRFWAFRVAS